jgi:hypothetical protein
VHDLQCISTKYRCRLSLSYFTLKVVKRTEGRQESDKCLILVLDSGDRGLKMLFFV